MKVVDTNGEWIGLAYRKEATRYVDHFSSPDSWKIGFDIVYRLGFSKNNKRIEENSFSEECRETFKKGFGLTAPHYALNHWGDTTVFWRVYWDRDGFNLNLLDSCENLLNEFAENKGIKIILYEVVIIPRSMETISELIQHNS